LTTRSEFVLKTGVAADDANGMRNSAASGARAAPSSARHAVPPGALGCGALGYGAFRAVAPADDLAASRALRVNALRNAVRSGRYAPLSEAVAEALLVWCVEPFPGPKALAHGR
jgi:hypothetical protein